MATTTGLSDRDYQALADFRYALRVFQRFSEQAARDAGLTPTQHQLLLAVRGHRGQEAPTIGDLAEVLQLRHHSVVELVGRAVGSGLVERTTDPDDQRRHRVTLTPGGASVLERLSEAHRAELSRFRDGMEDLLAILS